MYLNKCSGCFPGGSYIRNTSVQHRTTFNCELSDKRKELKHYERHKDTVDFTAALLCWIAFSCTSTLKLCVGKVLIDVFRYFPPVQMWCQRGCTL